MSPCRSELFSYTSCVSYAVLSSLVSLDRVALKARVVDSPEIRSVIGHVPSLETCLNALYDCKYKEFFKVTVTTVKNFSGVGAALGCSSVIITERFCTACAGHVWQQCLMRNICAAAAAAAL